MKTPYKVINDLDSDNYSLDMDVLLQRREDYARELKEKGLIKYSSAVGSFFKLRDVLFSCLIVPPCSLQKNYEVCLWTEDGQRSLGTWYIEEGSHQIPPSTLAEIKEVLEHATMGEMRCSDCGTWIPIPTFYKNSYFAGVYCDKCWQENGWKEREARETYE